MQQYRFLRWGRGIVLLACGLVSTLLIAATEAPVTEATDAVIPQQEQAPVLRLYAKPDARARIVGEVHFDTHLMPLSTRNGFVHVFDAKNQQTGWIKPPKRNMVAQAQTVQTLTG